MFARTFITTPTFLWNVDFKHQLNSNTNKEAVQLQKEQTKKNSAESDANEPASLR